MAPDVLVGEAGRLADDLRAILPCVGSRLEDLDMGGGEEPIEDVLLVGCGDCAAAAHAARGAFPGLAGLRCTALTPHRMLAYGLEAIAPRAERTLFIAASASGATLSVMQALTLARRSGAATLAVTSTRESQIAGVAGQTVEIQLHDRASSPGLRSYQATLATLLMLASQLGASRGATVAAGAHTELAQIPDFLEATLAGLAEGCGDAVALMDDGPVVVLGGGPNYGSACFVAAKLVETAGVFAAARDVDEWWHVERFALPLDMSVIVVAPRGASRQAAQGVVEQAQARGRRVIALAARDDLEMRQLCDVVLPIHDSARECWAPLLHTPAAALLAAGIATRFDRTPFRLDQRGGV